MTVLREITTEWGLVSGLGHVTVMYFDAAVPVASQRTALGNFWNAVRAVQSTTTSYGVSTFGRELDDATGTLTGTWTEGSLKQGAGTAGGQPLADATQMLIQWRTVTIINGRFVRGRTFIPGIGNTQIAGGNPLAASVAAVQTAANALIASGAALNVWHRPKKDPITHVIVAPGSSDAVSTASVWSEFAVLRRRRG